MNWNNLFKTLFSLWWSLTFGLVMYQISVMTQVTFFVLLAVFVIPVSFIILKQALVKKWYFVIISFFLLSFLPLILQIIGLKSPDFANVLSAVIGLFLFLSVEKTK